MNKAFRDVMEFMVKHGQVINTEPTIVDLETHNLRVDLIVEELQELFEAMEEDNLVEIADALADICYVVIGAAISYGIDLPNVWDAVHKNNMLKESKFREDGKVVKSEKHEKVDLSFVTKPLKILPSITKKEYMELVADCAKLRALEAAGVDNWEGYDEALEDVF